MGVSRRDSLDISYLSAAHVLSLMAPVHVDHVAVRRSSMDQSCAGAVMSSSDFSLDQDTSGGQNLIPEHHHDIITRECALRSAKVVEARGGSRDAHTSKCLDLQHQPSQSPAANNKIRTR